MRCPACHNDVLFELKEGEYYDAETGPNTYQCGMCPACRAVFDAADLDRAADAENAEEKVAAAYCPRCGGETPVTADKGYAPAIELTHAACGHYACANCISTCLGCGRRLCAMCMYPCADCGAPLCDQCEVRHDGRTYHAACVPVPEGELCQKPL